MQLAARLRLQAILGDFGLMEHEVAELLDVLEDVFREEVDDQTGTTPDQ